MGSQLASEEDKIRPWANDERLQDPFQLGAMNLVIKLVQEFATLAEKLPEGRMPKTQSIPATLEAVKDLKQESIKKLQAALKNMQDTLLNKDNPVVAGSREEGKKVSLKRTTPRKARKKAKLTSSLFDNNTRHQVFDEEGTVAIPFSVHHMYRLIVHALCLCCDSTILHVC